MSLTPTGQRELSNRLAGSNPERALEVARKINDPWFRCQALSQVARYWPHDDYQRLLKEAVEAADSQDDAYKQVTVSAWPIRAYLERGSLSPAQRLLERYTSAATGIENMGGRSEALFMLFQAAKPFAAELWKPVFWALAAAGEPALAWRQRRNLRLAIAMVALEEPKLAQMALKKLSDEKTISAIKRDLEKQRQDKPRPFFWLD
jgi:hypothetical protein